MQEGTLPTEVRAVVIALSSESGPLYHRQSWREPVPEEICNRSGMDTSTLHELSLKCPLKYLHQHMGS